MKKRIEKVVECVKIGTNITVGNSYTILFERGDYCYITNDKGNIDCCGKQYFKVVSEREVLEFDIDELGHKCRIDHIEDYTLGSTFRVLKFNSDMKPKDYDIKVIATPKEKTYEDMSKEELIKLLKAKE